MCPSSSYVTVASSAVRVIVVEDNEVLLEELVFQLESAGFEVRGASNGDQLDALLESKDADIVLLDVNLPFESGHKIARRLGKNGSTGIIMITGQSQLDDKLQGLANGADIYLVKPINGSELIAYIKSLWRRIRPIGQDIAWQLHMGARTLIAPNGNELILTPQEAKILQLLQTVPGEIFNRKKIVQVLDIEFITEPDGRINMMMSRLRQKLSNFDPILKIQTWRNTGYSYVGPKFRQQV